MSAALAVSFAVAPTSAAWGAAPIGAASDVLRLDLSECRRRASEHAPEVAGAIADVEVGRLGSDIANGARLPSLSAESGYVHSSVDRHGTPDFAANNGEHEYTARAVVRQPIYAGGSLTAARDKARAEELGAQYGLTSARSQVLAATDDAYFTVLGTEEKLGIARDAREVTDGLFHASRVRFDNGEVAELDVAKFELEVANATTTVHAAESDLAIARSTLAVLIQLPVEAFALEPMGEADASSGLAPLDQLLAHARAERPDLQRLETDLQALESAVGVARGARLPQVNAEAAGGYDSLAVPNDRNAGWEAGVSISLPLWDWSTLANRERIARLDVERGRQRLEAGRRAVTMEVTRRFHEAELARQRLDASAAAETLASRNATMARKGYDLGLVSSLDVITAEHQATTARSEHAAAHYDLYRALSQLEFATGQLR